MNNGLRIAFGNKCRVGKDTACEYLQHQYGGITLRFAEPIYNISEYIQRLITGERKKDPELLQTIGTELKKIYGANVWTDALKEKLEHDTNGKNIYIADMRFKNEAEMLKSMGFVLVKIVRESRNIDRNASHISETELDEYDKFDYVIENNHTIENFYQEIELLIKHIYA